jgi:hypothetical protein
MRGYSGTPAEFGEEVALCQRWAVLGGLDGANGDGPTVVFERTPAGAFEQRARLEPPVVRRDFDSGTESFGQFGGAVAADDVTIVVAAPNEFDEEGWQIRGQVAIYDAEALESDPFILYGRRDGSGLGTRIALAGELLLVGAPGDSCALLYRRAAPRVWREIGELACSGGCVAFDGRCAAVYAKDGATVQVLELRGERWAALGEVACGTSSWSFALRGDRLAVHLRDSTDEPGCVGLFRITSRGIVREQAVEFAADQGWYMTGRRAELLAQAAESCGVAPLLGGIALGPDYVALASYHRSDPTQCAVAIEAWR